MKLTLFMSFRMSLSKWSELGTLDRELKVYQRLVDDNYLTDLLIVSYDSRDVEMIEVMSKENAFWSSVTIISPSKFFQKHWLLLFFWSLFVWKDIKFERGLVLKTNQISGSWAAIITRFIRNVPLFGRCGYLPTQLYGSQVDYPRLKLILHMLLEAGFLKYSTVVSVPSKHQIQYLASRHVGVRKKLVRLPNFVDTEVFRPTKPDCIRGDVIFVGRLHKEKNLESLIKAVHNLDASITIVGNGELRQSLENTSKKLGLKVSFLGQVDQKSLPKLISSHRCFALPSFAEGMPKALLEAMACGTHCIGVDVDGVREFIADGESGFIAESPSANSISNAIKRALNQRTQKISKQAVRYIEKNFSIQVISELEKDICRKLIST